MAKNTIKQTVCYSSGKNSTCISTQATGKSANILSSLTGIGVLFAFCIVALAVGQLLIQNYVPKVIGANNELILLPNS